MHIMLIIWERVLLLRFNIKHWPGIFARSTTRTSPAQWKMETKLTIVELNTENNKPNEQLPDQNVMFRRFEQLFNQKLRIVPNYPFWLRTVCSWRRKKNRPNLKSTYSHTCNISWDILENTKDWNSRLKDGCKRERGRLTYFANNWKDLLARSWHVSKIRLVEAERLRVNA